MTGRARSDRGQVNFASLLGSHYSSPTARSMSWHFRAVLFSEPPYRGLPLQPQSVVQPASRAIWVKVTVPYPCTASAIAAERASSFFLASRSTILGICPPHYLTKRGSARAKPPLVQCMRECRALVTIYSRKNSVPRLFLFIMVMIKK